MRRLATLALSMLLSTPALAQDWYVITGIYDSQEDAWRASATLGGWVLDHDVYNGLKPNRFSLVRGPFDTPKDARKTLRLVQRTPGYEQAYIKDAGDLVLPAPLGAPGLPPIALAALLGELEITAEAKDGGHAPCVPSKPHWLINLRGRQVWTGDPPTTKAEPVLLPSHIAVMRETGEVVYLTGCASEPPPFVPPPGDAHRPPDAPEGELPAGETPEGELPAGETPGEGATGSEG